MNYKITTFSCVSWNQIGIFSKIALVLNLDKYSIKTVGRRFVQYQINLANYPECIHFNSKYGILFIE